MIRCGVARPAATSPSTCAMCGPTLGRAIRNVMSLAYMSSMRHREIHEVHADRDADAARAGGGQGAAQLGRVRAGVDDHVVLGQVAGRARQRPGAQRLGQRQPLRALVDVGHRRGAGRERHVDGEQRDRPGAADDQHRRARVLRQGPAGHDPGVGQVVAGAGDGGGRQAGRQRDQHGVGERHVHAVREQAAEGAADRRAVHRARRDRAAARGQAGAGSGRRRRSAGSTAPPRAARAAPTPRRRRRRRPPRRTRGRARRAAAAASCPTRIALSRSQVVAATGRTTASPGPRTAGSSASRHSSCSGPT